MMSLNYLMVLIQCQIFKIISSFIIKKYETLPTNPIHVYIIRINNRLVFKMKDEYKLELQMPETMKLCGGSKKLIGKSKNAENVPSLKVILVQCNLIHNQYQQKSEVLYTFIPNKSHAYLLNVELSKLVCMKT